MFSPIEQFDQIIKLPLFLNNFEFSVTNVTLSIFIVLFLIVYLFSIYLKKDMKLIPLSGQIAFEEIYKFIINIIKDQMGLKNLQILPIIIGLFFLIGFSNLLGLTPFGISFTSYMQITFFFSLSIWLSTVIGGLSSNGLNFLKVFVPKVGGQLVIVLIIIELLSYGIRAVSLAIRLSANITAGHTLLHVIGGLNLGILKVSLILFPVSFLLLLLILVLEFGIAFVQSYVFVMLTCIYINDAINITEH